MEVKRKIKNKKKLAAKKPAVLRYRAPKTTKMFDEGVPANLLNFSGLKLNKPTIKFTERTDLSPFIVSFVSEKPAIEELPLAQLNFAVPEYEFRPIKTAADESLLHEDLLEQFLEEERTPFRSKKIIPAAAPVWPSFESIKQALRNFTGREEIIEPVVARFDLDVLQPVYSKPAMIVEEKIEEKQNEYIAQFDLPEMEENETAESEILTWDDVVRSTIKEGPQVFEETEEEIEAEEKPVSWLEWWSTVKVPVHFGSLEMSAGWHRALVAFVLLSFVFVLPLHAMETIHDLQSVKNNLSSAGVSAVTKLNEAVLQITANSASAATSFEAAKKDFSAARSNIESLNTTAELLLSVLPSTHKVYTSGVNLISAGEEISSAGEKISQGLSAMQTDGLDTTGKLAILTKTFEAVLPALERAEKNLKKVDPTVLPAEYQDRFSELQTLLPSFLASAKNVTEFSDVLATLLGAEGKKRYLLLFQNNTEIRPTGGFIGSFAILDVSHGEITNLEVPEGGSYDLQGSLKENIVAPLPLQLISARWEFQDSNWFPDFPTSARQALEFYEDAGWPTVDGVVAVNATFVSSLLSLLGPVEMSEYDRTIDSENFLFETQKMVETDYVNYQDETSEREEAAPKAFIGDLAEALLSRVGDLDTAFLLQALDAIQSGLTQKDIQLYFPDEAIQKVAQKLDWTGEIKQTDRDYLMITDTNLGGGKTDLIISEKVDLKVSVQPDGRIINTLTINRKHNGINGAMFTGVNNVNFMRVYVPKGSRLISSNGFSIPDVSLFEKPGADWERDVDVLFGEENTEVDPISGTMVSEEAGKTVFGNWTQTRPGEASIITFVYELPFDLSQPTGLVQMVKDKVGLSSGLTYSLLTQKQSGFLDRQTSVTVDAPNLKTVWSSEATNQNTFSNETDSFISFVFE
ncbi:MAG: DUF4012 domain-containing protein [Patescibacteria group bacterium]|jgi:hypothetical protein